MPIFRKSCWCCSLRIGSIIIGALGIVFAIIALTFSLSANVKTKTISAEYLSPTVVKVILCLNVAMFVAASVFLIVGAVLRKLWYLIPWLAIHLLMTVAFLVSSIYTTVQFYVYNDVFGGTFALLSGILLTALYIYFWLVVFSYFQFLRESGRSNSGSSTSK